MKSILWQGTLGLMLLVRMVVTKMSHLMEVAQVHLIQAMVQTSVLSAILPYGMMTQIGNK